MADRIGMMTHFAVQALRAGWYIGLRELADRRVSRSGPVASAVEPRRPMPSSRRILRDLGRLLLADARNVRDGVYPPPLEDPAWFARQFGRGRAMLQDVPAADRRRHAGAGREVASEAAGAGLPDYYVQNFHYQSGGYLTAESARLYDTQVETLFLGGAGAMRRQALVAMAEFMRGRDQRRLALLDVACGTGAFLQCVLTAFPALHVTGVDLSAPYLAEAARGLGRRRGVALVEANAEALPFADASQDIVTCIFLYHELPGEVRRRVTREIARVLKPDGLLVFIDSLQTGDEPDYDGLLEVFPARFHEPYFADYVADDLDGAFEAAGLRAAGAWTAFLAKVVVRRRAAASQPSGAEWPK